MNSYPKLWRRGSLREVPTVGFFALVLYRQVGAQEGSLLLRLPHLAYRVLKTALRLRPRRALSSASGQNSILAQN
jgi:hypothetical protein